MQNVSYPALKRDLTIAGQVVSLTAPPIGGEVIVDNLDATFVGAWTASTATAGYSGSDYKALPTLLSIPAGSLSASVSVQAFPDSVLEGSETVIATITANAAYTIASPANVSVTIFDPPFERWKTTIFTAPELSNPLLSGNTADFDHDGRSNFLEYALGNNPRLADGVSLPALGWQSSTQLRFYYNKGGSGLTFEVQQTPSLTAPAWTHAGIGSELYDAVSGLFYQATSVAPSDAATFLRLYILQP